MENKDFIEKTIIGYIADIMADLNNCNSKKEAIAFLKKRNS